MEGTRIAELLDFPEFIPTVVHWFRQEWPDSRDDAAIEERLCGSHERNPLIIAQRNILPVTLVAIHGSAPVGFVSLIQYEKGIEQGRPHWIDALYVEPSQRGKGLARQLLLGAEAKGAELNIAELFALTEIPQLYFKCGWRGVEEIATPTGRDLIVAKSLAEKE